MTKADNVSTLTADWTNVPSHYLLRHLGFPELLEGPISGEVSYSVDRDNPDTLNGNGLFSIQNGQFSADYLLERFGEQLKGDEFALQSLKFDQLRSDLEFRGDRIITPNMYLEAESIKVSGEGSYVMDGDLNYDIKVAIPPATAERMPILQKYLNVEGYRLTQTDIELGFHISGPGFNPSGAVTGLPPVSVTLASGAAEVTSTAIKVIDSPRQILLDVFKIVGGIVGPQR